VIASINSSFFDSVLHGFAEMEFQLVRAIQSNQRGHSDEAAIALG
jgi:hypothetical protein